MNVDDLVSRLSLELAPPSSGQRLLFCMVDEPANLAEAVSALRESLPVFLDAEISLRDVRAGLKPLLAEPDGAGNCVVVAYGFDSWTAETWGRLDVARSIFLSSFRNGCVFLLGEASLAAMEEYAQHTASMGKLVRANTKEVASNTLEDTRLEAYRKHFAMSDDDAIEQAKRGAAPTDPDFSVWLTLLGRGDLVGSQ
ncbi:MAG: hypothetical protein U0165_07195 [Polyangiaceae bacterium]